MKTYFSWHQRGWDHVPFALIKFTQPTFFPQSGCLFVTETLTQVHRSGFTTTCSKHTFMSAEFAETAWYSKPARGVWPLKSKQRCFMRRHRALNSLMLGLAQHLQTFRGPELYPTTASLGAEAEQSTSAWYLEPVGSSATFSRLPSFKAGTIPWVSSRMQLSGGEN